MRSVLLFALVGSASGFTVSSPEADAAGLILEDLDKAALLAKPDLLKAAEVLRAKFSPVVALAAARFGHLLEPDARRKLQDLSSLDLSSLTGSLGTSSLSNPQAVIDSLRPSVCNDATKQGIKALVPSLTAGLGISNLPSLDGVIDTVWPCLCSDLDFSNSAYTSAIGAATDLLGGSSSSIAASQSALQAVVPVFFSSNGGVCTASCRNGGVAFLDWALSASDVLLNIPAVKSAIPWLPSLSALNGLPSDLASCVCDGLSWTKLVALFGSELTTTADAALAFLGGSLGGDGLNTPALKSSVATLAKYPAFIFGSDGFCSTNGCQNVAKKGLAYGKSVLTSLFNAFSTAIPTQIVTAASAFSTDDLLGCFCGGTMNWEKGLTGLSETLSLVPADINSIASLRPLIAAALTSVFSPHFLCSSGSCKTFTSQLMAILDAVRTSFVQPLSAEIAAELQFSTISWCPAEKQSGSKITQDFTLAGDAASFGATQQTAFKESFVAAINSGITNDFLRLTTAQVSLTVTDGSINVQAAVDVATPDLASSVTSSLTTLSTSTPTALSSTLGVTVEAVAAPATTTIAESKSSVGGGGSSSTGVVIIAIIAGVVVVVALVTMMMMKNKKKTTVSVSK